MRVELGIKLAKHLQNMVKKEEEQSVDQQVDKVFEFIEHVKNAGLIGLEGRNKDSSNVPLGAPDYDERVKKAKEKKWWHYHVGIWCYDTNKKFGDRTSEYIIHYANYSPYYVRLAKLDYHPPFRLPFDSFLAIR
ncbi:hypothetical protein JA116_13170 [Morganella morganii]|uniref:hypothetical protein n=1 Tax=Morganella morganii TaxID=582 RepID=UPI000D1F42DD|nr:hypothetical protein [Morganella morganii]QXO41616.1 hypothetical protein CXB74_013320 [Morganella morganii]QXO48826.1 hypothetical protein JC861_13225 [Morganella morganii]QXO52690.1 hypothetical protein JC830_13230 [Morganella morganii]QXO60431.1 hypothetical protein JC826_13075 [Morganella morganii]QXO67959.1 hypothetical protein JC792_13075 [Morganella morganii]